jgi:hypothetical protein
MNGGEPLGAYGLDKERLKDRDERLTTVRYSRRFEWFLTPEPHFQRTLFPSGKRVSLNCATFLRD